MPPAPAARPTAGLLLLLLMLVAKAAAGYINKGHESKQLAIIEDNGDFVKTKVFKYAIAPTDPLGFTGLHRVGGGPELPSLLALLTPSVSTSSEELRRHVRDQLEILVDFEVLLKAEHHNLFGVLFLAHGGYWQQKDQQKVSHILREVLNFLEQRFEWIKIAAEVVPEGDYAASTWVALNYLANPELFQHGPAYNVSVGVAGQTANAAVVAFLPPTPPSAHRHYVHLGGHDFPLYAKTHVGYGARAVQKSFAEYLLHDGRNVLSDNVINDPCVPKGNERIVSIAGENFTVKGALDKGMLSAASCMSLVKKRIMLTPTQTFLCTHPPCSILGVHQPPVPPGEAFVAPWGAEDLVARVMGLVSSDGTDSHAAQATHASHDSHTVHDSQTAHDSHAVHDDAHNTKEQEIAPPSPAYVEVPARRRRRGMADYYSSFYGDYPDNFMSGYGDGEYDYYPYVYDTQYEDQYPIYQTEAPYTIPYDDEFESSSSNPTPDVVVVHSETTASTSRPTTTTAKLTTVETTAAATDDSESSSSTVKSTQGHTSTQGSPTTKVSSTVVTSRTQPPPSPVTDTDHRPHSTTTQPNHVPVKIDTMDLLMKAMWYCANDIASPGPATDCLEALYLPALLDQLGATAGRHSPDITAARHVGGEEVDFALGIAVQEAYNKEKYHRQHTDQTEETSENTPQEYPDIVVEEYSDYFGHGNEVIAHDKTNDKVDDNHSNDPYVIDTKSDEVKKIGDGKLDGTTASHSAHHIYISEENGLSSSDTGFDEDLSKNKFDDDYINNMTF